MFLAQIFFRDRLGIATGFSCLDPSAAKHLLQTTKLHACIGEPRVCTSKFILGVMVVLNKEEIQVYKFSLLYSWIWLPNSLGDPGNIREQEVEVCSLRLILQL